MAQAISPRDDIRYSCPAAFSAAFTCSQNPCKILIILGALKTLPQRLLIAGLACPPPSEALAALCGALLLISSRFGCRAGGLEG
jgi:hypothetical protein